MFTDPINFTDKPLREELRLISFELLRSQADVPPNIMVFANKLGSLTLDISLVRLYLKLHGYLDDIPYAQQLSYVREQLEHWKDLYAKQYADNPHHDGGA